MTNIVGTSVLFIVPWKAARQGPVITRISPLWRRIGVGAVARVGPPNR